MATFSVERFINRRKCKPEVAARLRRLNPNGVDERMLPRGYFPARRSFYFWSGLVSVREFITQYGREAYENMPEYAFKRDGHRKALTQESIEDHLWMRPNH